MSHSYLKIAWNTVCSGEIFDRLLSILTLMDGISVYVFSLTWYSMSNWCCTHSHENGRRLYQYYQTSMRPGPLPKTAVPSIPCNRNLLNHHQQPYLGDHVVTYKGTRSVDSMPSCLHKMYLSFMTVLIRLWKCGNMNALIVKTTLEIYT